MGLTGTVVRQVKIKSDGDVFHEIFRYRPHHTPEMSPGIVKGVHLCKGDWGSVGSIIEWRYIHDGKERSTKDLIEAIDEEKRSVTFKVVEGDLTDKYKNMTVTVHVDTKGDHNLVTWTFVYEKLSESVPDPVTLMDVLINLTKDIETHHLK